MGRDLFLVGAAVVIVAVAQQTDPGTTLELAGLTLAAAACVARGLGVALPAEAFAAAVIVPVTLVVGHRGNVEVALFLPVMVTLYTSWYLGSTIRAGLILVAAVVAPWIVSTQLVPESNLMWVAWAGASAFTFTLGLTLRRQRGLIEQLEAARHALARQAVAEERRRIARELHDLAGHTLAAMLLHVTGARHVLARDPAEARRALRDAETVGRSSLDQIRIAVAALRTDERGTDPALAGSVHLDELFDAYRRAGLSLEARIDESSADLVGPAGTAVHRITQEALANVARHAPGNAVTVVLSAASGEVTLTVTDRGRSPAPSGDGVPHFGLVGMRERARALGGHLVAGPHGNGWRVAATLPLAARASAPPPVDPERIDVS